MKAAVIRYELVASRLARTHLQMHPPEMKATAHERSALAYAEFVELL